MSDANHRFLSCLTLRLDKPKENCGRCLTIAKYTVDDYNGTRMDATLPRLVGPSLQDRLRVMPAVVVTGAPSDGEEHPSPGTLMPGGRRFLPLDDLDVVDAARRDPEVLLGGSQQVTLDEVQREPDLLHAMKRAIDQQRQPGKCLITGRPTCY